MPTNKPSNPENAIFSCVELRPVQEFPMSGFVKACEAFVKGGGSHYVNYGKFRYRFDPTQFEESVCTSWFGDNIRLIFPDDDGAYFPGGIAYATAYLFSRLAADHAEANYYHAPAIEIVNGKLVSLQLKKSWTFEQRLHLHTLRLVFSNGGFILETTSDLDSPNGREYTWKMQVGSRGEITMSKEVPPEADPRTVWGILGKQKFVKK